jgi:DNA-binding NarL/FixJ family response regulator
MSTIIIIDDDPAMDVLVEGFRYRSHEARRISSASDAIQNIEAILSADIVILDILMSGTEVPPGGFRETSIPAGMEVLREIRKANKELPVVVLSAIQNETVIDALHDDSSTTFVSKWESHPVREIVRLVHSRLGISRETDTAHPIIVHGRADARKLELKNYIQNTLRLPEPVILHEQPSIGRTIIEKFEDYASQSELVFVLITPDDCGALTDAPDDVKRRARQNVIFEMGYFLGVLGRKSGRVLLLHEGPLELPSDLAGVVYIDISNGINAAGETIRKEINAVR